MEIHFDLCTALVDLKVVHINVFDDGSNVVAAWSLDLCSLVTESPTCDMF